MNQQSNLLTNNCQHISSSQHRNQPNVSSRLLEDAELALENLDRKEVQLVKEAEELFKKQVDYIIQIDELRKFLPDMNNIDVDTRKLSNLVDSSANLVADVCSEVRRIDLAKARLEDCLSKVGDVLDLRTCCDGIKTALKLNNYEEAAIHIKRYLSIDQVEMQKTLKIICNDINSQSIINEENTPFDVKSMHNALKELDEAKIVLFKLCQENLSKAIQDNNTTDIERFFKLFPLMNKHSEGLSEYSKYLQSKIINPLEDKDIVSKRLNQADKLAALYENIAKLVDSHQPLIETYYGPGHLIYVIKVIQKDCDRLSRKILEEFRNETKLQHVAKIVRSSILQSSIQHQTMQNIQNTSVNINPNKLDPRDVDKILNEISVIISRSEVYIDFIVQRIRDDIDLKSEDEQQKKSSLIELYNLVCIECELNHLIQEVGGIYVMLEQFYLNESSKKAILMDQIDVESSSCFVSSMLDDIFFIIKKCTKRAISTKSIEVFCAIINHCVTLLESTFCKFLEDKLINQQYYFTTAFTTKNLDLSQAYNAIQSGRYLQSTNESEMAKAQYFSALNNLDKACDYIKTLRGILDSDLIKLKTPLSVIDQRSDNQIEKSATCLNELSQLSNKFSSVANTSLYQLFNATLKNRLKSELKTILNENPELNNDLQAVDGLTRTLLLRLDRSLQDNLTSENWNKLISITKDFLRSSIQKT